MAGRPKILRPVRPTRHQGRPGPRPFMWKTGPDPRTHQQYTAWLKARSQAAYRREPWQLTFEQYQEIWGDLWESRGRTRTSLCLSRRDYDLGWDLANVEVLTRQEHAQRQASWGKQARRTAAQIAADQAVGIVRKRGQRLPR